MADDRTRRWQRSERLSTMSDTIGVIRSAIAAVRHAPEDLEVRRHLRAVATAQNMMEQVALLLLDEARANANKPTVALAFWEEVADVNENLDQPLEVISAMEHVVAIVPTDADHLDRLAWLYRNAGAWQRAAETFERVGAIAQDERSPAALRAAGKLYAENGQLDRAAAAYRTLVEKRPHDGDAWRMLDETLGKMGQWQDVARVRALRAQQVTGGVEKAALLRAQARALEQAGDLASAAKVVQSAATHAPDNLSGLVDYADVLARSGKPEEAAEILRQRVTDAVERGADREDIASLRLRLAGIIEESSPAAARAVLEELLADAPEYVPALERMTAHAAGDPEPRVHAMALLRYAAALPDGADRSTYIVAAGRRYREANDYASAIGAFEQALVLVPDAATLRKELDEVRTAAVVERATEDAQTGDRKGSSERRLRQILETQPHHVGANLALVEILVGQGRIEDASEHLRNALSDAPEDTSEADLARMVLRLARVSQQLGEDDEAHQLLHDAHRLDRRSLVITLALGESCFARKLWRQAALYLGAIADHPDTARHASEVAIGLVHAALSEVRALRPTNAPKHYEAAVRIDPHCTLAWHALAEAAIERGELPLAADYLENEACYTVAPKDRLRLFDALGDMALDVLGDEARAERYWMQLAEEGIASEEILDKLHARLVGRGATLELGTTCMRLAQLTTESVDKKPLLEQAAEAFAAGGDHVRAMQIAEDLVQRYPRDPRSMDAATTAAAAAGDAKRVVAWLRGALAGWESAAAKGEPSVDLVTRAKLFRKLGDAQRDLDDTAAALLSYQRAVDAAPASDAAMGARRGLVELASSTGHDQKSSLIALVEVGHDPFDILAWARSSVRSGDTDEARAAYELARALGARLTPDDERFLVENLAYAMASDEGYASPLSTDDRVTLIDGAGNPEEATAASLGEILALLGDSLPMLVPTAANALVEAGVPDGKRVPSTSDAAVVAMYPQIVKALSGPATLLYSSARTTEDLRLLLSSPPVIVVGRRLLDRRAASRAEIDLVGDGALRFELGRIVELSRPTRIFAAGQDPESFALFVAGIRHAFGGGDARAPSDVVASAERVRKSIPVPLRAKLTERLAVLGAAALDPHAYRVSCERAADRAGMLVCGDVHLSIEMAGGVEAAPHLVHLASSKRYIAARKKLVRK